MGEHLITNFTSSTAANGMRHYPSKWWDCNFQDDMTPVEAAYIGIAVNGPTQLDHLEFWDKIKRHFVEVKGVV